MKYIISLLIVILKFNVSAQTQSYAGNYIFQKGSTTFTQNLNLNTNGTFTFHSYEYHE